MGSHRASTEGGSWLPGPGKTNTSNSDIARRQKTSELPSRSPLKAANFFHPHDIRTSGSAERLMRTTHGARGWAEVPQRRITYSSNLSPCFSTNHCGISCLRQSGKIQERQLESQLEPKNVKKRKYGGSVLPVSIGYWAPHSAHSTVSMSSQNEWYPASLCSCALRLRPWMPPPVALPWLEQWS